MLSLAIKLNVDHQNTSTSYNRSFGSLEIMPMDSVRAWAISIRSKGSLWCSGNLPAIKACSFVITSVSILFRLSSNGNRSSGGSSSTNLPKACFIATSHVLATLQQSVLRCVLIIAFAFRDKRWSDVIHHINTCVSSRYCIAISYS